MEENSFKNSADVNTTQIVGDLLPLRHRNISEIQCLVKGCGSQPLFEVMPNVLDRVEVRDLRKPVLPL